MLLWMAPMVNLSNMMEIGKKGIKMTTNENRKLILDEVKKVIKGKDQVVDKVFMAILAKGHILIEDIPGVGKTTLALALSRAMSGEFKRLQFTPDVVPSDIVGFNMYRKEKGSFEYIPGAVFTNVFLADEINRTSAKTQSALLEVMEEGQATVDGVTHGLKKPFTVIATQNPAGGAGTQLLPQAQMDRFLIRVSMGYPDFDSQMELLRDRQVENPLNNIVKVSKAEDILAMQDEVENVYTSDEILRYITNLTIATRQNPHITLGISPRGALALNRMAKANAYLNFRDYVVPEDIRAVFIDVCAHRLILSAKARIADMKAEDVLRDIINDTPEE